MRRSARAVTAAALLTTALGVWLLLPALAFAADDPSWAGTYTGVGSGKNKKGKKGSSGATVWVEDLGSTVRLTFRFDKLPVVVDVEGTEQASADGITVPLSVSKMGVRGSATVTLTKKNDAWQMLARGSGKALKYEGTGVLVAKQTATGVVLPSTTQQFDDLFESLSGGTPASSKSGAGGTKAGATAGKAALVEVKPAPALAPARSRPPVPTDGLLAATGAMVVTFAAAGAIGFGRRAPSPPSGEGH